MILFDDVVAARFLSRLMPEKRDALLSELDALVDAPRAQRGLLAGLVTREVVPREQAYQVLSQVEAYKRSRAVAVYAHLLVARGKETARVKACLDAAGADADPGTFGRKLVEGGVVSAPEENDLRFHARVAFDKEQAQHVDAYVQSRRGAAGAAAQSPTHSGPFALPKAQDLAAAARAKAAAERAGSLSGIRQLPPEAMGAVPYAAPPSTEVVPPQFTVPDWIDTSDPQTNKGLGPYRVLGKIGAGAMGVVYLADKQEEPTRPIALKVLHAKATEEARGRFKREILANGMFSHPGVIDVYDAGRTETGQDYLAMEFFDGQDLEQILETEGKPDAARAVKLCRQVFEILGAAHQAGIVHRDVKPSNILVSRDGQTAKLMDFGIAVIRDLGEFQDMVFRTVDGTSTGTPQYMSPEQAAEDNITASSDLYSMGLVLYVTLSGRLPFESETSHGFMNCHMMEEPLPLAKAASGLSQLPKELHVLLDRLLKKNPADRPANAEEVCATLDQVAPKLGEKKGGQSLWGRLWSGRGG